MPAPDKIAEVEARPEALSDTVDAQVRRLQVDMQILMMEMQAIKGRLSVCRGESASESATVDRRAKLYLPPLRSDPWGRAHVPECNLIT